MKNNQTSDSNRELGHVYAVIAVVFIIGIGVGMLSEAFLTSQKNVNLVNNNLTNNIPTVVKNTTIANRTSGIVASTSAVANVVAVTSSGKGLLGSVYIELIFGKGRVLISTNPFIEPDTQYSAETARDVAVNFSGKNLGNYDIIISFNISLGADENSGVVGGPSAGSALTMAMIAVAEGRQVREDVAMTGTINKDSSIGQIGGVLEKAEAAGKAGMKIFLVPVGQVKLTYYEKQVEERRAGGFVIQSIKYIPKTMNLNEYTMQQWNMSTIEVRNISEAMRYALE